MAKHSYDEDMHSLGKTPYESLALGIYIQALEDWKFLKRRGIKKRNPTALYSLEELTNFFQGKWCAELTNGAGERIFNKVAGGEKAWTEKR